MLIGIPTPRMFDKKYDKVVLKKFCCDGHGVDDAFEIDGEIYCKVCGTKLKLVPAWLYGESTKKTQSNESD